MPTHEDGYQCYDELVQKLGKILRDIHRLIPDKDAAGHADALVGIITSLYSALASRALDLDNVLLMLRDDDEDDPINHRIEQAFRQNFDYDKSDFRQHLLDRLIQEEEDA
jgi:hypothetical protein